MEDLLTSWWGMLVIIAGGLAVIVGFAKNIRSVREWYDDKAKDKVRKDDMEARIMQAVNELSDTVRERDEAQSKSIERLSDQIRQLTAAMDDVQEQSSALTYDKLMAAYTKHCVRRETLSVSELTSLQRIYEAYTRNGRNHVPVDFMQRLKECPIET